MCVWMNAICWNSEGKMFKGNALTFSEDHYLFSEKAVLLEELAYFNGPLIFTASVKGNDPLLFYIVEEDSFIVSRTSESEVADLKAGRIDIRTAVLSNPAFLARGLGPEFMFYQLGDQDLGHLVAEPGVNLK